MIIGAIINGGSEAALGNTSHDGYAAIIFYTMAEAIQWATLQSQDWPVNPGTGIVPMPLVCTIVNTSTSARRWWYNGTEVTG